jgi:PPOX class probable F420-dependent enzyme
LRPPVRCGRSTLPAHLTSTRGVDLARLTDKQAQLLLGKNFGSLATLNEDGSPQVTPVWVDWDGQFVLVNTLWSRAKPKQIARDPRVEISVTSSENPYQHVRIAGSADLVDEGAEEHIDKLAKKYVGEDSYPWRSPGDRRVIVRIRPERVADYNLD